MNQENTLKSKILDLLKIKSPKEIAGILECKLNYVYQVKMYQTRPRKSYYVRKTKPPKPPKPIKIEEIYHIKTLDMPDRLIQWDCECGYQSHEYFITCPICSKENPLNGKGMKI